MLPILYDIAILAVLALFLWRGWHKGLILSLCGLVVVILSLVGANFIADTAAPPVAKALQPKLAAVIEENLTDRFGAITCGAGDHDPVGALQEMGGVYAWAAEPLQEALETASSSTLTYVHDIALFAAKTISTQLAHHILFAVAFVVLFILLTLLLHALDLVAKLPGLNFCNGLGGGLIGLVKGMLVLFVVLCVLRISSSKLFAAEVVEKTYLFKFFVEINPVLALFPPT